MSDFVSNALYVGVLLVPGKYGVHLVPLFLANVLGIRLAAIGFIEVIAATIAVVSMPASFPRLDVGKFPLTDTEKIPYFKPFRSRHAAPTLGWSKLPFARLRECV